MKELKISRFVAFTLALAMMLSVVTVVPAKAASDKVVRIFVSSYNDRVALREGQAINASLMNKLNVVLEGQTESGKIVSLPVKCRESGSYIHSKNGKFKFTLYYGNLTTSFSRKVKVKAKKLTVKTKASASTVLREGQILTQADLLKIFDVACTYKDNKKSSDFKGYLCKQLGKVVKPNAKGKYSITLYLNKARKTVAIPVNAIKRIYIRKCTYKPVKGEKFSKAEFKAQTTVMTLYKKGVAKPLTTYSVTSALSETSAKVTVKYGRKFKSSITLKLAEPEVEPTVAPTEAPSATATQSPTPTATVAPTATEMATAEPTKAPTAKPTATTVPTVTPTTDPTKAPSPTATATQQPTEEPTQKPTEEPTKAPTPTVAPVYHTLMFVVAGGTTDIADITVGGKKLTFKKTGIATVDVLEGQVEIVCGSASKEYNFISLEDESNYPLISAPSNKCKTGVTADMTLVATYAKVNTSVSYSFLSADGKTTLGSGSVEYGQAPETPKNTVPSEVNNQVFKGWLFDEIVYYGSKEDKEFVANEEDGGGKLSDAIKAVTDQKKNVIVYAYYELKEEYFSLTITGAATIKNEKGEPLDVSRILANTHVFVVAEEHDGENFAGWENANGDIVGKGREVYDFYINTNMVLTATYSKDEVKKEPKVTFRNPIYTDSREDLSVTFNIEIDVEDTDYPYTVEWGILFSWSELDEDAFNNANATPMKVSTGVATSSYAEESITVNGFYDDDWNYEGPVCYVRPYAVISNTQGESTDSTKTTVIYGAIQKITLGV